MTLAIVPKGCPEWTGLILQSARLAPGIRHLFRLVNLWSFVKKNQTLFFTILTNLTVSISQPFNSL